MRRNVTGHSCGRAQTEPSRRDIVTTSSCSRLVLDIMKLSATGGYSQQTNGFSNCSEAERSQRPITVFVGVSREDK